MSYIVIDNKDDRAYSEIYEIDTEAGLSAARAALRNAGIESAPVWVGDSDSPDTYKNGQTLFAADGVEWEDVSSAV